VNRKAFKQNVCYEIRGIQEIENLQQTSKRAELPNCFKPKLKGFRVSAWNDFMSVASNIELVSILPDGV